MIERQPIAKVEWEDPRELHANDYNPNRVYQPEFELLATSILRSGWTQPIVARSDGEIVDGFHRWSLLHPDSPHHRADVAEMTDGLVPVVRLSEDVGLAEQKMATIRHNRARGHHVVVRMANIVRDLHEEHGMSFDEISEVLSMELEEVDRLYDARGMTVRGAAEDFGRGWVPA